MNTAFTAFAKTSALRGVCLAGTLTLTLLALSGAVAAASDGMPVRGGLGPSAATAGGEGTGAGPLRAFLLAGSPDSSADLEAHAGTIGVLYPTYFYCRRQGSRIAGEAEPSVDEYAAVQHIVEMPRFSCQQKAAVHRILTDPALRRSTLAGLIALARNPLYRGLCLDLENDGASDREALSSFVAALARRLHALGKRLSVVVDGVTHEDAHISTGFYDDSRLSTLADEVFVLAWGLHWEGSAPGPIAPLPWVRKVAAYVASLPHARRFVLGVPMYGLDWAGSDASGRSSVKAVAYQYAGVTALERSVGAVPARDALSDEMTFRYFSSGVRHTVYYLDAHAVTARLQVGRDAGLAVGVWRLGSEDQSLWSSLP